MSEPDVLEITSIRLSEVVRRLAASRWLVPAFAAVGLALGVVAYAMLPRVYVSEATILPSSGSDRSAMSGSLLSLAGTLGITLPGSTAPESHLFPAIMNSERIVRNALATPMDPTDAAKGTLFDVVVNPDAPEALRIELATSRVRENVLRVSLDEETSVVRLVVRMADPKLANRTAQIFLDELAGYLRHERTAQSRDNREFVEGRRNEAAATLAEIEDTVRRFRETNRKLNNSPDLLLDQERLLRDLRVQEEVFLELTRQYEIARIEEQKATPVLEILDPPTIHYAPRQPKLPVLAGAGLLLGIFVGSFVAVFFESPRESVRGALHGAQALLGMRG